MSRNRLPPEPQDDGQNSREPAQTRPAGSYLSLPLPTAPKPQYCWMCHCEIIDRAHGRNLEDPTNEKILHIHHACFDRLSDDQKVMIRVILRQQNSSEQMAAMMREAQAALSKFHQLIDFCVREYRHRSEEECGGGEN
jgi:hypothetical protein